MEGKFYSKERNVQILVQLLKDNGIRKCIASPGTVNISFVGSLQNDDWFEVYSCVDERSAAYMACGLAEESGEPVVITCTGATASRNYLSAMTEAFYRKIPVIAVTASPSLSWAGHNMAQFIDRSVLPNDVKLSSYVLQTVKDKEDEWDCEIKVNRGLNDLKRKGGGPVHFNLISQDPYDFSVKNIAHVRRIEHYYYEDIIPNLPYGRIGIFVACHSKFSSKLTDLVDLFCYNNNAVVLCDHTSGYYGKYKVLPAIITGQSFFERQVWEFDLIIHLGEVSGDYYTQSIVSIAKEVWRISEDGLLKDTFHKLSKVFEMKEEYFFENAPSNNICSKSLYHSLYNITNQIREEIPDELPFSNIWIARKISGEIPARSVCHFGILNTLRCWNFFELPKEVYSYCNVGGFGIDGILSTLIGASLYNKNKLYFCFLGDLSFFYDLNSIANRHVSKNIRIMLVNNGKGVEFRNIGHPASLWGDDADKYFAAGGHFGNMSKTLVKNFSEGLGFKYISASSKDEFISVYEEFVSSEMSEYPIVFEVFVDAEDDKNALGRVKQLMTDDSLRGRCRNLTYKLLSESTIKKIKSIIS